MISRKAFNCVLLSIVMLALILRGVASFQMYSLPSVQSPSPLTDMATYMRLAGEIVAGQWPDHFDYQPFYYSIFLPFCRFFGGDGIAAAIVVQALLGALACLLAGLSAARLFGRRSGICAALVLAVSRMHVFYTPFMLFEVLQSFWIALLLWLSIKAWDCKRSYCWLLLALVLSCSVLTRGNALFFLPGLACLFAWRNLRHSDAENPSYAKIGLLALSMLLLFEVPQLPYSIRNWNYAGRWCGASTAGDKVLALGNTPEAPPGGLEYPLTYSRWVAQAEARHGRVSMLKNVTTWALREPVVFLDLKWRALLLFWDRQEIPNNVSLEKEGKACPMLAALPPFAVTGTLAFMGMLLVCVELWRCRRDEKVFPLRLYFIYMLLCSWFSTALFYNLARFRITSLPLMAIGAGYCISLLWEKLAAIRTASRDEWLKLAFCGIVSVFAVCFLFGIWQENVLPVLYRYARPDGLLCEFPDTRLLYDHGPFTVGGFQFLEVPKGGVSIRKQLKVPKGAKNVAVRIPVLPTADFTATLTCDGKVHVLGAANLVEQRFLRWLELRLPELDSGELTFTLPQGMGFGVDFCRDYGRTALVTMDGRTEVLPGEAAVEAQW